MSGYKFSLKTKMGSVLFGVMLSAGACGLVAPASAAETVNLARVTGWWPSIIVDTAAEKGFFEKHGIKVESTDYKGGGAAFQALAAGAADMTFGSGDRVAAGLHKGVASKLVYSINTHLPASFVIVKADSPITDAKQLNGKTVAITSAGSLTEAVSKWLMKDQGISFNMVPVGGAGLIPNLITGKVDAAIGYDTIALEQQHKGTIKIIYDFKRMPDNLSAGVIALDSFVKSHPKAVQGFVDAYSAATQYLKDHPDYGVKAIGQLFNVDDTVAKLEYERIFPSMPTDHRVTLKSVQSAIDLAELSGQTGFSPADQTFTNRFVDQIGKQ